MEPTAVVGDALHKQWRKENKSVSHNWKKGFGWHYLNQLVGNWTVKPHVTIKPKGWYELGDFNHFLSFDNHEIPFPALTPIVQSL